MRKKVSGGLEWGCVGRTEDGRPTYVIEKKNHKGERDIYLYIGVKLKGSNETEKTNNNRGKEQT